MTRRVWQGERGVTLIELMIAMTVFVFALGAALSLLQSQVRSVRRGVDDSGVLQNLRFGTELVDLDLRTAGTNVPDGQPSVVYASAQSFAFNADYVSNLAGEISAVYVDLDAPVGSAGALAVPIQIPGSSPAFTYPSTVYTNSPAETITFFFQADASTARSDDFVLMRQVNNHTPEPLVRNVLAYPGRPFFRYYYHQAGSAGNQPVPVAWLPLRHTVPEHGGIADTGIAARVDSIRAVELSFGVTNGRSGTQERVQTISTIVPMPNLGIRKLRTCGRAPLFGQVLTASQSPTGPGGGIDLSWNPAVDEKGGEQDVLRYLVWRRVVGTTLWGEPLLGMPAGKTIYQFTDVSVVSGATYDYAVAAQDCTPNLSSQVIKLGVTAP